MSDLPLEADAWPVPSFFGRGASALSQISERIVLRQMETADRSGRAFRTRISRNDHLHVGGLARGADAVATSAAPTAPAMPGFGWNLNDTEIADVLTYVRNTWGNAAPAVQPEDVTKLRGRLQQ